MYVCVYYVCMYICVYYICMYDVTLRRVQETIAAVLKAINITYLCARARVGRCVVCVCGGGCTDVCCRAYILTYPARNAHAPYCHLSFSCSTVFFEIINGRIFGKT